MYVCVCMCMWFLAMVMRRACSKVLDVARPSPPPDPCSPQAASLTPERIQQTARLAQRPSSYVDPRLLIDLDGRTPFSIARRMRNVALMRLLNPLTPIEHVFDDDSPEARIRGVPRLLQLAAQVCWEGQQRDCRSRELVSVRVTRPGSGACPAYCSWQRRCLDKRKREGHRLRERAQAGLTGLT